MSVEDEVTVAPAPEPDNPSPTGGRRGTAKRASWNLIDQGLSAATNAALTFIVAHATSDAADGKLEYGAFAVAFMVFTILIGIERALVGQPMSIKHSGDGPRAMRRAIAEGLGTVLAVMIPAGLVVALVGVSLGGFTGSALIAVGVLMPGLIMQDACRLIFFAQLRPKLAAFNDALWAVLQFVAIGGLIALGQTSATSMIVGWGVSALICAVIGTIQLGVIPRLIGAVNWIRRTWSLAGYLLAEFLLGTGVYQGGILAVAPIVGAENLGYLRTAAVLIGPLGILSMAMITFLLPEISKRTHLTDPQRWRIALAASGVMTAISLAYTLVMVLLPDAIGEALVSDKWAGTQTVLLPICIGSMAGAATLGPALNIYAMGLANRTFILHAFEAPLMLGSLFVGATFWGAPGAAWGLAADQVLMIPIWYWTLHRILAQRARAGGASPGADESLLPTDRMVPGGEPGMPDPTHGDPAV